MSHYNKEMISIYTNTTCNLDCKYCYTNKENYPPQEIDLNFAEKLIRDYFTRSEYTGFKRLVRFFAAGEPTLNMKALMHLVHFTHQEFGDDVEFELQTNGVFTNKNGEYDFEIATWVANNIDYIWISCDGTPDIQDEYRPVYEKAYLAPPQAKSHDIMEQTIKFLVAKCKKMVGVRMTIVKKNLLRQKEMIDYFYNLGIRDIWADPLFPSVGYKKVIDGEEFSLDLFAEEFVKACEYASTFGKDTKDPNYEKVIYGSNYTCNFDEDVKHYCRACKPVPHATTDGYVTACDMAMFREKPGSVNIAMNDLFYGQWNNSTKEIVYWNDSIKHLQERNCDNMQHCKTCEARLHCGGYCLGEVTNETGQIDGALPQKCKALRYIYRHMNDRQRRYRYSHP